MNFPGIYQRISPNVEWMQQRICELSDSPPDYCENASSPYFLNEPFIKKRPLNLQISINIQPHF